ncbi:MAG TPA: hypothetical protein VMU34_03395 [Mycobacterium sp.]|nr:hypothetical protein [Mycobacterium sp.]
MVRSGIAAQDVWKTAAVHGRTLGSRLARQQLLDEIAADTQRCITELQQRQFQSSSRFARRVGLVDPSTGEAVDLDDEARQQADAERAEADKRERRKVLALNSRLSEFGRERTNASLAQRVRARSSSSATRR